MADIVERLRDSDTTRRIGESYADVHDRRQADRDEAADTITRLRYDLADAITEQQWQRGKADDLGKLASSLTARVEELEGVLNNWLDALNDRRDFEHHQPYNFGKEWKHLIMRCQIAEDEARAAIIQEPGEG